MTRRGAAAPGWKRAGFASLAMLLLAVTPCAAADDTPQEAAAHEAAGRLSEAADVWRRVLANAPADAPADGHALRSLARLVLAAPRPDLHLEVGSALQAAADKDPTDLDLRLFLGRILLAEARAATSDGVEQAAAVRARAAFEAVLDADPASAPACLGLARALELGGKVDEAIAALDEGLAHCARADSLVVEKGRILYEQAVRLHEEAGRGYPLPAEVARAFRRAQGALLGAGAAAGTDHRSWLRLAWASQTLGDIETALHGYQQAIAAAPDDPLPLRGLRVLYSNDAESYEAELTRMAAQGAPLDRVLLLQARDRVERKELEEADRILDVFLAAYPDDADGLYGLGELREAQGRKDEASVQFRRAVEADGDHLAAADRVDKAIRQGALTRAKTSLDAALGVEAEYAWLVERTPRNPFVRNNAAFLLREAWIANKGDAAWRPVLDAAVSYYDDAVRVIGPWTPEKQRTLPWATRHAFAQIVNDAGVIRHLYEPSRDLVRAEHDYLEAMRYAEWGYSDAWTYLQRIYRKQERWQELHRLACRAANALANAKGEPLEKSRAAARAVAEQLEAEGKVE